MTHFIENFIQTKLFASLTYVFLLEVKELLDLYFDHHEFLEEEIDLFVRFHEVTFQIFNYQNSPFLVRKT